LIGCKNLQVNALWVTQVNTKLRGKTGKYPITLNSYIVSYRIRYYRVFTIVGIYLVFTWKIWPKVKTGNYREYLPLGIYLKVFTITLLAIRAARRVIVKTLR